MVSIRIMQWIMTAMTRIMKVIIAQKLASIHFLSGTIRVRYTSVTFLLASLLLELSMWSVRSRSSGDSAPHRDRVERSASE